MAQNIQRKDKKFKKEIKFFLLIFILITDRFGAL